MSKGQSVEQFKGQPRLPKFAIPKRYDLFLKPDLSSCKFSGSVQVSVDVVDDTGFLVFNAADLAVDGAAVLFRNQVFSKEFSPSEILLVEEDEILVLRFDEILPHDEGVLQIGFEGTLNDKMKGFYIRS